MKSPIMSLLGEGPCFTLLISVAFVLLSVQSAWASKPDSVPDWVRAAAHLPLPAYPPETNAVVLLDETTYSVEKDGHASMHCRHVLKILRPQGRRSAMVEIGYDHDTKIDALHVWSISPEGREYAVRENEVADHGYFGDTSMYVEDRVKAVVAPGSDPGGVVAYEYDQKERPFLTEKTWFFQEKLPSLKQSFTLSLPPDYEYGTVWANHASTPAIKIEGQRWRWELSNTPGVDLDQVPMHPYAGSLSGRMTIHYSGPDLPQATSGTWKSIGQWYQRLEEDRLAASPDITAKTLQLTSGSKDFYDRTEVLGEFVQQQIRYFGIELGIGGYQPHHAGEIYKNRYGDCKDKSTLLAAMLSAVGVHSALLMVDTHRGMINPDTPSIVGNHMVVAIEIPQGYSSPKLRSVVTAKTGKRYLIFDPTWDETPFGQLENNLQGSFGLLVEGADSQVIELPILSPEGNTIHRSGAFTLQTNGTLSGTVNEKRFGDVAEVHRIYFSQRDAKEQQEYLDRTLSRDFTSFKIADVRVKNAKALNKAVDLSYALEAESFGRSSGTLIMLRPRILGHEELHVDKKPRVVSIDLGETIQEIDDYTITLPSEYVVDDLPEPIKIDTGFASYESSSSMENHTLHYRRKYTVRAITLPPEKYSELQRLFGIINADEQRRAVFKKLP